MRGSWSSWGTISPPRNGRVSTVRAGCGTRPPDRAVTCGAGPPGPSRCSAAARGGDPVQPVRGIPPSFLFPRCLALAAPYPARPNVPWTCGGTQCALPATIVARNRHRPLPRSPTGPEVPPHILPWPSHFLDLGFPTRTASQSGSSHTIDGDPRPAEGSTMSCAAVT
jgi:hypothetical protein